MISHRFGMCACWFELAELKELGGEGGERERERDSRFKPLNLVGSVSMVPLLPPIGGVVVVAAARATTSTAAAAELHLSHRESSPPLLRTINNTSVFKITRNSHNTSVANSQSYYNNQERKTHQEFMVRWWKIDESTCAISERRKERGGGERSEKEKEEYLGFDMENDMKFWEWILSICEVIAASVKAQAMFSFLEE